MKKFSTRHLTFMALFIALNIVLVRFVPQINLSFVRYDFGFLPISLSSIFLGPIYGGITAMIADIIGLIISGQLGQWFPGFTVNAILYGFAYGLFLYKKEITWKNVSICVVSAIILLGLILNPIWLYIYNKFYLGSDKTYYFILTNQIIKSLIMIPTQIITIKLVAKYLKPHINLLVK